MKTIALCIIGVAALGLGLWPAIQQKDPKAEIKRKHRDARYSNHEDKSRPISLMSNGTVRRTTIDFVEPDDHDAKTPDGKSLLTPEAKAAIRNKLAIEHTSRRKAVACESVVILFGKIKEPNGYITTDDTAIYTVYQFAVNNVYRAPQALGLSVGSVIEVTAPGGVAKTKDGNTVAVEDPTPN